MVDIFDAISTSKNHKLEISELLETMNIFELLFDIVKATGFYNQDENFNLINTLNIDTNSTDCEDALYKAWSTMGNHLNTSKTQEEFNAKFALYTPIILKKMEAISQISA